MMLRSANAHHARSSRDSPRQHASRRPRPTATPSRTASGARDGDLVRAPSLDLGRHTHAPRFFISGARGREFRRLASPRFDCAVSMRTSAPGPRQRLGGFPPEQPQRERGHSSADDDDNARLRNEAARGVEHRAPACAHRRSGRRSSGLRGARGTRRGSCCRGQPRRSRGDKDAGAVEKHLQRARARPPPCSSVISSPSA